MGKAAAGLVILALIAWLGLETLIPMFWPKKIEPDPDHEDQEALRRGDKFVPEILE